MLTTVNTSSLTWCEKSRTFSADASDLQWPVGYAPSGVRLRSHRTGIYASVSLSEVARSDDYSGGWSRLRYVSACGMFGLVVHND